MSSFVKLSVQEIFPNIQYLRNSDGSICSSSPIGFGTTQNTSESNDVDFSTLVDLSMDNYAKSFSKSSKPDETAVTKAKYIINALDTDKNGTVSINELNDFKNSNLNSNLEKQISNIEEQFKIYDKDQDGELNLNEIENVFASSGYSAQELGQMAKEFHDSNLVSKDDKPILSSDIV